MSVILETSKGQITIDLFVDECPKTCLNFLKLCKIKYYNNVLFFNVQKDLMLQTGDPTGTGSGGKSVFGLLEGDTKRFFKSEITSQLRHTQPGMVGMANFGENCNASSFYITTDAAESLDDKYTLFGEVVEGLEVLSQINDSYCDDKGRPFQDVRIRHTHILDDPYDDPKGLSRLIPSRSPRRSRPKLETVERRLADDVTLESDDELDDAEREEKARVAQAKTDALALTLLGKLPDEDVAPPENVLFVCKLNPVTEDEDLEAIFSRHGEIVSCEVIRDKKTAESLQFAFIEFKEKEACNRAYTKMNNVLIDDRRIKVDFSQSVSKLWNKHLGVKRKTEVFKNLEIQNVSKHKRRGDEYDFVTNFEDDDEDLMAQAAALDEKRKMESELRRQQKIEGDKNALRSRSRSRNRSGSPIARRSGRGRHSSHRRGDDSRRSSRRYDDNRERDSRSNRRHHSDRDSKDRHKEHRGRDERRHDDHRRSSDHHRSSRR
eukprot:TRINITY_DN16622_c0_g1_i1.p1 TRINITY_DN16622_c0_g1~~TRINITY_DN16622_c0_g1_i1.p1  ORF type:complete len:490 (+),score=128.67 TRINITY_DN16622_c0_g1_i1:62-1531(+)